MTELTYTKQIAEMQPYGACEGGYNDGFYHARDDAWDIAHEADLEIAKLKSHIQNLERRLINEAT